MRIPQAHGRKRAVEREIAAANAVETRPIRRRLSAGPRRGRTKIRPHRVTREENGLSPWNCSIPRQTPRSRCRGRPRRFWRFGSSTSFSVGNEHPPARKTYERNGKENESEERKKSVQEHEDPNGTLSSAARHRQDRAARGRHRDEEGSVVEEWVDRSGEGHIGQQNDTEGGNRPVGPGQSRRIGLPAPEPNHHHRPERRGREKEENRKRWRDGKQHETPVGWERAP